MRRSIIIVVFVIVWVQLFGQNEEIGKLVMQTNDFDRKGNIKQSISTKKELIKLLPSEIIEISLAKSFALINEIDSSFFYLEKNTVNSSDIKLLTEPEFYFLLSDPRWTKVETHIINNYLNETKAELNIDFTKELLKLKLIDQSLFYRIELAEKREDILMSSYLWFEKDKTKNESYAMLKSLIDKYGYPTEDQVTKYGTEAAFLIIQHLEDLSEQESHLPQIKKYSNEGKISRQHYAYLIDRIRMRNHLPQIYGTQLLNGKIYKVEDLDSVNQLRKEVGLPKLSIEQFGN